MRRWITAFVFVACGLASPAHADQVVVGGMSWMTQFPATWNAAAPKLLSDGLHAYAVVCGFNSSPELCSVVRRRGLEEWRQGNATFVSHQPAIAILDRLGRLNVFSNNPRLRHIRFDHPSVDLIHFVEVPVSFDRPVGYLHASYDAASDTILLAFNETTSWTAYVSVKDADADDWISTALPRPDPDCVYMYARTLRANGRYFVLAGEHPNGAANADYTAAVLFESSSPSGPWSARDLRRVTGINRGVPYKNWVYPIDLQADSGGNVRALIHVNESDSGHSPLAEGLHVARQEDGFALRHVGSGIDDGFPLVVDSSGVHLAFALIMANPAYAQAGHLVYFRSDDGGATWQAPRRVSTSEAINPSPLDPRNGSMVGGKAAELIYSSGMLPPFHSVFSTTIDLGLPDSENRYDYWSTGQDGTSDYVRAFSDRSTGRSYFYMYDYQPDGSFVLSYCYRAGAYYRVYVRDAAGITYYDSAGYQHDERDASGSLDALDAFKDTTRGIDDRIVGITSSPRSSNGTAAEWQ